MATPYIQSMEEYYFGRSTLPDIGVDRDMFLPGF